MGLFDLFRKTEKTEKEKTVKRVEDNIFNTVQFQNETLAFALTFYMKNGHDYDRTFEMLRADGLNENQSNQIITKLRAHMSKMVKDFENELSTGRITDIKIKPTDEHKKGEVGKDQVDRYIAYGVFQMKRDDFKNALELFDKALELDDKAALAYANKGTLYNMTGNKEKALYFFDRALEYKNDDKRVYLNKALLLDELGKNDEAIASYERALEIDSKDVQALNNLGVNNMRKGDFSTALKYLNKAIEENPNDNDTLVNKLTALTNIDIQQAFAFYHKMMQKYPDSLNFHPVIPTHY